MFQYNRDCTPTPCEPGVTRRVMTYTKDVMLCEITFETGARGNEHPKKYRSAAVRKTE